MVAAAGNMGPGGVGHPASDPQVISVGAVRFDRARAVYSGFGPNVGATDGGIFNYGDAPYLGSTANITLNKPIVAIAGR